MSVTLEDSANAPLKYAGSRALTAEDERYTLRLMKKFQPEKFKTEKMLARKTVAKKTFNQKRFNLDAGRIF